MDSQNGIDLSIALKKLHQLSAEDGDLGHEYWNSIIRLLKKAGEMQAVIDRQASELESYRAKLRK